MWGVHGSLGGPPKPIPPYSYLQTYRNGTSTYISVSLSSGVSYEGASTSAGGEETRKIRHMEREGGAPSDSSVFILRVPSPSRGDPTKFVVQTFLWDFSWR